MVLPVKQFLKFTVTGVSCFALDFGLMVLFTECCHISYLISSGLSFTIATIINYAISKHWVFFVKDKSAKFFELLIFLILSLIGLALNTFLLWLIVEKLHFHYMPSKIVSSAVVSIYNYITRKFYLEEHKWR